MRSRASTRIVCVCVCVGVYVSVVPCDAGICSTVSDGEGGTIKQYPPRRVIEIFRLAGPNVTELTVGIRLEEVARGEVFAEWVGVDAVAKVVERWKEASEHHAVLASLDHIEKVTRVLPKKRNHVL